MKKPTKKEWMAALPKALVIPKTIPTVAEWRLFDPKTDTVKFRPPRKIK